MTHLHWTIHAYKHKVKGVNPANKYDFGISDFVEVGVKAQTEEKALAQARTMIKRRGYRVVKVWECERDEDLQQDMAMMQLKLQAEALKKLS